MDMLQNDHIVFSDYKLPSLGENNRGSPSESRTFSVSYVIELYIYIVFIMPVIPCEGL